MPNVHCVFVATRERESVSSPTNQTKHQPPPERSDVTGPPRLALCISSFVDFF